MKDFPQNIGEQREFLLSYFAPSLRKWWNGEAAPIDAQQQSAERHDLWSAYLYGDEVKVVFYKALPKKKTTKSEVEYERLENMLEAGATRGELLSAMLEKHEEKSALKSNAEERFQQSLSRSRAKVFELAMCNEFRFFGTFTLNKELRDRYNLSDFRKAFAQYVRNLNRSRPEGRQIKYLMIPEQHKNGAWHMHGLLLGIDESDLRAFKLSEKLPKRIKDQIRKGETVYDWAGYRERFGFFTATKVKEPAAVSRYITKYLTKDMGSAARESGEHLYFASQGLKHRENLVKNRFGRCPIETWDFENDYIKTATLKAADIPQALLSEILDSEF